MAKVRFISPIVLLLLAFGCRGLAVSSPSATTPQEPSSRPAATPVTAGPAAVGVLRLDETLSLGALRLRWLELNDSRCPQGVQCPWEGQVVATVEVSRNGSTPQRVTLVQRPGAEPVAAAGHELRLLNVEPYPREGISPERIEYVATIEIRPL